MNEDNVLEFLNYFLDQKNSNLLLINILDNNIQIKESFVAYGDEKVDVTDKIIKMRE